MFTAQFWPRGSSVLSSRLTPFGAAAGAAVSARAGAAEKARSKAERADTDWRRLVMMSSKRNKEGPVGCRVWNDLDRAAEHGLHGRGGEHLGRRAGGEDAAAAQQHDLVGEAGGLVQIVQDRE